MNRYSDKRVLPTATLKLAWELDGQIPDECGKLVYRTQRIRISWEEEDGKQESFCLVLLGRSNGICDDNAFLGRERVSTLEKLDLMKEWIDNCVGQHKSSCADDLGREDEFEKLVKATYFGVIDVVNMELTPLPASSDSTKRPEKYVALSYVWGDRKNHQGQHVTTRANVIRRTSPKGLREDWETLPTTIKIPSCASYNHQRCSLILKNV